EDPLQTAVGILLRNRPTTPVHKLPISRRLDTRAVSVVQSFYPDLPFKAAVLPGVRELRLTPAMAIRSREKLIDRALDNAAAGGRAHVELPPAPVLTADPEMIDFMSAMVGRLAQRGPRIRCETQRQWRDLPGNRVAIGVSHNDQKDLLRSQLDGLGFTDVVVET